jgi:hypothetical protein
MGGVREIIVEGWGIREIAASGIFDSLLAMTKKPRRPE